MGDDQGLHPCQLQRITDPLVEIMTAQFLVRCRCHQEVWSTWREGDAPYLCPVTGASLAPADE